MSESRMMPITRALQVNPQVSLARGQEYPFVEMADLVEQVTRVRSKGQKEFKGSGTRFQDQDTLFARITPCLENGKIAKFCGTDDVGFGSTEFIVFRGRDGLTTTDYAHYLATSPHFRSFAISKMTGSSGRQRVPVDALEHYEVLVPSLDTQRAITKILGDLDDKIDLLRKMNRTLEKIARAVFRAWFVDFEPVHAKASGATSFHGMPQTIFEQLPDSFSASDLGDIPNGWRVRRVDDLLEHPRRTANPNDIESTTPYIGLEHMPRRSITLGEWETAEKVTSNKHRFERRELLFGKLRPNFHKVGVTFIDGVCSTDIVVLRPIKPEYFGLGLSCVSSDEFVDHNVVASSGTKMPRTNWEIIGRYELATPQEGDGLIMEFDTVIRSLVDKLEANTHEITTLTALRNALLPGLISGELAPPDLNALGLTPTEQVEATDG